MSDNRCIPPRALHGYGSYIRRFDRASDAWVVIGGTGDLTLPNTVRDSVLTNDDDGDGTMHYIPAPQTDVDDVEVEGDFIKNQYETLLNLINDPIADTTCWQIVLNDPQQTFVEWCGFLTAVGAAAPKEDLVTATITIHASGGGVTSGQLVT